MKKFSDLPIEAKNYLSFIEKTLTSNISLISTGPKREVVIEINNPVYLLSASANFTAIEVEKFLIGKKSNTIIWK